MRGILCLGLAGCTAARVLPVPCDSTPTCRQAFGLGSVCQPSGLCAAAELPERCMTEEPLPLPGDVLPIGTVFDHSLVTHEARYLSVELAIQQNPGFEGWRYAGVHCDNGPASDGLDKDEATLEVTRFLAEEVGIPAIVGPSASSRTELAYGITAPVGTLLISPSASASSLADLDGQASTEADPGLLWRTTGSDELQVRAIVQDMQIAAPETGRRLPSENVAVVYQAGTYGEGIATSFQQAFSGASRSSTVYVFSDAASRSTAIAQAANGGFDELLFASSDVDDVIAFLRSAATLPELDAVPLFLTDAARNTDVLLATQDIPDVLGRVRGTAPATPSGPVNDAFTIAYATTYGTLDVSQLSFTANAFDAAWLVQVGYAWAAIQEGRLDGLRIARGLRQVSSGPSVELGAGSWDFVLDQFYLGDPVDVEGASGPLDYGPDGETQSPISVWVVSPAGDDFTSVTVYEP